MSRSIQGVIKRRTATYPIVRFDRAGGYIDDNTGLWVDAPDAESTIKIHIQPVNDEITDGVEGQRQLIEWHGWAVDSVGNEISNKDKVTIGSGIFTVANIKYWPGVYREFDLIRSGEAENLSDT